MVLSGTTFSSAVRFLQYEKVYDKSIDPNVPLLEQKITSYQYVEGAPQSVKLPNSQSPGYSHVFRNAHSPEKLITSPHPSINTVKDFLESTVQLYPDALSLGERKYSPETKTWSQYEFQTFAQIKERVINLASGLVSVVESQIHGAPHPDKEQYNVGFYGPNTRNWFIADMACVYSNICSVALYDTLGKDSSEYIINLTEMPAIFVSIAHVPFLLSIKSRLPHLKIIILLNDFHNIEGLPKNIQKIANREDLTAKAKKAGVVLYDFSEVESIGKRTPRTLKGPSPDDVFTLNFTSGTTGNHPKGVILTHGNVAAGMTNSIYKDALSSTDQQYYLSFLPLAHIYERLNLHMFTLKCFAVGFIHGDVVTCLFDDIKAIRPHFICGVPRIWNKLAAQLRTTTLEAPGDVGEISRKAYSEKLKVLKSSGDVRNELWDPMWTDKIRQQVGFDRTATIASGAAPLSKDNIDFLMCALGVDLLQGYGLTETCSGFAVSKRGDLVHGSNGPVAPNAEIRLRSLPELGYSVNDSPDPRGEIMIRGPQVFRGYYKNEQETLNSFDADGWFHTGDVGRIDSMGRIFIVDRVKNMFKLAQGEYVAPERLEALYSSSSSLISQIFLDGNSHERYLVAIIGVNPEPFSTFLNHHFGIYVNPKDLPAIKTKFSRKDVRKAFLTKINDEARQAGVQGFEVPKNLALFLEPLSFENGTLTPTMKLRRIPARKFYETTLKDLYKEGPLEENPLRHLL
ncbi:uncharacterized protein SAPINGB_P003253 [Magnusiomyces paraingens]|uniref:AMP-dependent synthetase/ligase domain-containing protein n=1 Tax=Magnusiomyces paraingens TaxID=2606893 RepID=A0A5E8BJQ4_9ASCO|nr:uncharacterized protein SAPINGB_P003253 [Saprochaete ingens]VVT51908.1 unnamed protein product [Saprochaete ingens]